jgi:acetamidase/formamidase
MTQNQLYFLQRKELLMALHTIEPERRTLHGYFSRDLAPVLTIDPGDTVRFRTLDAGWGLEGQHEDATQRAKFEPRTEDDDGHALCGPIFIRDAKPGMTLSIHIDDLQVGSYGWTGAGGWSTPLNDRLKVTELPEFSLQWKLDGEAMTALDQYGNTVSLRPFMGVMGMPLDVPGKQPTPPPRITGGNMDCKELVAGTTLYLPIAVEGGLFSTGDGHAAQGDGEVSVMAIEAPMERCELTFDLLPDLHLTTPRANTPSGWITLAFHEDLDEAIGIALEAMLDLMGELYGYERQMALALASVVVDVRITQLVNAGVRGVHAFLPHGAIR